MYIWSAELRGDSSGRSQGHMCTCSGKSNALLSCQMRILLPHLLFSNLENSSTRGLHSLLLDAVRALLRQPDLCFYPP